MDSIRAYAVTICVAMLTSSFAQFIVPEGSLKKTFNKIVSIFMLVVIVTPLSKIEYSLPDVNYNVSDNIESHSEKINDYIIIGSENIITDEIDEVLKNICKGEYTCEAEIVNIDVNSYKLNTVKIGITKTDMASEKLIISKTKALTNVTPEVYIFEQ